VIGMFTLICAPTRMPVVVSKRLIGTRVGPAPVVVPMKVLVPTPLRLWVWVVVNWAAVAFRVMVIGVAAITDPAMPTAAIPETNFAILYT
jgi:hypothetical protein